MAEPKRRAKFKGGGKTRRDRSFGIVDPDFWRWLHRVGKHLHGGRDLEANEASNVYNDWINDGKPKAK